MSEVAAQFSYAVSSGYLNKEPLGPEKGTWRNKENVTLDELFSDIRQGLATTSLLALNSTNLPEYIANHGLPNPSLGPYRRRYDGHSERLNENAVPDRLANFDLDGDCTIERAQELPTVKELAAGISTSSSHKRKNSDAATNHRLRLHFVLPHTLPTFFDDEEYSEPLWQWLSVRRALLERLESDLDSTIEDDCGMDAARIWYGNTGPPSQIGGPKGQGILAGESIQITVGNVLPLEFVKAAIARFEPEYRRSPEQIQKARELSERFDAGEYEVGTPKQIKLAGYILSNRLLADSRATDYHSWYLVARVCKKLDPAGTSLVHPFLKFCEQSLNQSNIETLDTVLELWDRLPSPEDTRAGITSLKDAADIDSPGWREHCPLLGFGLAAQSTVNYLPMSESNMTGQYLSYLDGLKQTSGQSSQSHQPSSQATNQFTDYTATNNQTNNGFKNGDF